MPLYEYECKTCGKHEDAFRKISEHKNGPKCCGEIMSQVLGKHYVIPDLDPYWDENLGKEPLYVKSKQHRKKLMKEHGVSELYGKGWK